jgi:hypothetical protein
LSPSRKNKSVTDPKKNEFFGIIPHSPKLNNLIFLGVAIEPLVDGNKKKVHENTICHLNGPKKFSSTPLVTGKKNRFMKIPFASSTGPKKNSSTPL